MQEIPIHVFGVSLFVFRDASDGKRLLLLKRSERYLNAEWCQIAGAIEQGEKAWQTALRELNDEHSDSGWKRQKNYCHSRGNVMFCAMCGVNS